MIKGTVARCSQGKLGIITDEDLKEVTYEDGTKAFAYVGIHLSGNIGAPWSSRHPQVLGHIDEIIDYAWRYVDLSK
jgi:hypothetical protein